MKQATKGVLARAGVERLNVRTPVGKLSPGARQSLDIARVTGLADLLEIEHPLVLFDEPTTALDQEHEENFLRLLGQLRERAAVVFVSHRLPEVLRTCGRIVVLKDGDKVAEREANGIGEGELHRLMVGRVRAENYYLERDRLEVEAPEREAARLTVEGASAPPSLVEASFTVAPGEILGVAGTEGSGKRELGEAIAGVQPLSAGQIRVDGRVVRGGVAGAVAAGVGFVPADRQRNGLISGASIVDNIQLASLHDRFATSAGGVWRRAAARRVARQFVDELGIVAPSIDAPVSSLSGGNQQKVLLAKWLLRDPAVIVLDTPTQGVDTGARESIYEIIRRIARKVRRSS